jgi:hypothetical protein
MDNKFNDVINSLNELTKSYEIFVPSLNKKVKFTGISAKQQKETIQCVLDKDLTGITFSILGTDILLNNLADKSIQLLISDKNYLLACLRALSLSDKYKTVNEEISLTPLLNHNISFPEELKGKVITDNDLTITIETPTLGKDRLINNETKNRVSEDLNSNESSKEFLGEVYMNEVIKFIKLIKTPKVELNFDELTFKQKIQVVEKFPVSTVSSIVEFINKVREFDKSLFTVDGKEIIISIDPTLFTL